jgi:PEGA domain
MHFNSQSLRPVLCLLVLLLLATGACVNAQDGCGGKKCPEITVVDSGRRKQGGSSRQRSTGTPKPPSTQPAPTVPVCEDSELVIVCGMRDCEIVLEANETKGGKFRQLVKSVTDNLGGYTFHVPGNQYYKARVAKLGYESFGPELRKVDCDDQQEIKAPLKAKPVTVSFRTNPVESDIYLEGEKQPIGRSDANGLFSYFLTKPTLLIEARKKGYLSDTRTVLLAPELASREILLSLEPISATLLLTSNVPTARITIDNQKNSKSLTEKIPLAPGRHTMVIEALGYTAVTIELSVVPEEVVSKQLTLKRLPISSLQAQASSLFERRAYDDVLKLTRFIFETDAANGGAHLLAGLVAVDRADFSAAQTHLDKALTASESVSLRVRRHPGEKFELNKGHESCDAQLILNKTELEFLSNRTPAENFKVPYDQVRVVGIQVKNRVAVHLSTKVTVGGKKRDYNFYSFDRELSESGKAYLELIQRLMRSH